MGSSHGDLANSARLRDLELDLQHNLQFMGCDASFDVICNCGAIVGFSVILKL